MFLTDEELRELTHRQKHKAQARVLRAMGIEYKVRADGSIAVLRSHVEKEMGGAVDAKIEKVIEPNWSAI